jgi:hypothetical protein
MNSASFRSSNVFVDGAFALDRQVRILAIVDPPDPSNLEHNEQILRQAARLAQRTGAEFHIASAYSAYPENARSCRVDRYLPALRVKARDRCRCAIRQLLRRLKITQAVIHVVEGEPAQVVDALASSLNAVVVDGAAALGAGSASIDATRQTQDYAA